MGAHDFHGRTPSRAGRTLSKLGPGIIDARRLAELLAERTCDCEVLGVRHRPDQCAAIKQAGQTTPGHPRTFGPDELPDEWDEGGES